MAYFVFSSGIMSDKDKLKLSLIVTVKLYADVSFSVWKGSLKMCSF